MSALSVAGARTVGWHKLLSLLWLRPGLLKTGKKTDIQGVLQEKESIVWGFILFLPKRKAKQFYMNCYAQYAFISMAVTRKSNYGIVQ